MKDERAGGEKKSVIETESESVSGLYGLDGGRRESRSEAGRAVCVKGEPVVSGLISLPQLIRSIYFKCCFNLSNLC